MTGDYLILRELTGEAARDREYQANRARARHAFEIFRQRSGGMDNQLRMTRNLIPLTGGPDAEAFALTVDTWLTELQQSSQALEGDQRYTPLGRVDKRSELVNASARLVAALALEKMRPLEEAAVQLETQLLAPEARRRIPEGMDAEECRWAEREARERFAKMDPLEVESAYMRAVAAGDRQTIRAIELAPTAFPLLSPDALGRGAELYAQTHAAEKWGELQAQREAIAGMQGAVARATQLLSKMVGPGAGLPCELVADPVAAAATAVVE